MAKVGLDFGHGSNTFPPSKGVYKNGKGYAEHDFNAKLGMRIKEILEANSIKVILGQQPNKADVPLQTRTNLYNKEKVDLVFSVHANAGGGEGRCAFYWYTAKDSKKLAETVIKHIKAKGYSTHGNGLHASEPNSWTNLHICRETSSTAVLVEHGFMDTDSDFELVFGSKQSSYIEDMAQADAAAIMEFLGVKGSVKAVKAKEPKKGSKPKAQNKSISQLADEVIAGKHGSGNNRKKALGSQFDAVQKLVNEKLGAKTKTKPKPAKKSIDTLVKETLAGKYGNGEKRKNALGSNYKAVMDVINGKSSAPKKSKPKSQSISQMADKIINDPKAPSGHEARRKWLDISKAEYEKVRKEVNKRL